MPRIFKGSESTLRLLISKTGDYQALTEIKIKLYTTDIENAIEIIDGIQVCKNIAIITLAPRAFMGMEDGLINYIIDGATEDDVFHTERQSNYMLKSLSYINEDGVATQTMTIESNGEYRVTPNDGLYVDINVNVPDLNGSYDDGFNVGYEQGKTDGVNEQKTKLESINITENGTYTKEDGYNHIEVNVPDLNGSYDEGYAEGEQEGHNSGYSQGQADVAANARVLNVTENGVYQSKFSDPAFTTPVTGVYADGTEFYSCAELNGAVYNTKIKATKDSRLEFWFKGKNTQTENRRDVIINANGESIVMIQYYGNNNTIIIFFGSGGLPISDWDNTVWHHLIISRTEGFWIDGKHIDYSSNDEVFGGEFFINGNSGDNNRNSNGTFGMIKIDDVVIIPTADGFLNTNTGELLEIIREGEYTYTENPPKYGEGELYKTINVNVAPKISVRGFKLKFRGSKFKSVPEIFDFNGVTDMSEMFFGTELEDLSTLANLDLSECRDFSAMFSQSNIEDASIISTWTYPSNSNWGEVFSNTRNIKSCPAIYTEGVDDYYQGAAFWNYGDYQNLTDFGGYIGLKYNMTKSYCFNCCVNFTHQTLINILNGLYDFTGNGETPKSNQGQIAFPQVLMDKLSEDDKMIAINKGWQLLVL